MVKKRKTACTMFWAVVLPFFLFAWIYATTSRDMREDLHSALNGYGGSRDEMYGRGIIKGPQLSLFKDLSHAVRMLGSPDMRCSPNADKDGSQLDICPSLIFRPGTVELTHNGQDILNRLVLVLRKNRCRLAVIGHADSSESKDSGASLWELSAARSGAVIRYFIGKGIPPDALCSISRADTLPVVPPFLKNAQKLNGRLELYFYFSEAGREDSPYIAFKEDKKVGSLSIPVSQMFEPGTTQLAEQGKLFLDGGVKAVTDSLSPAYVAVRSHADSSEENQKMEYPSLWELSAARSNAVVAYLMQKKFRSTLHSVAYADTVPETLSTETGSAWENARIEFDFYRISLLGVACTGEK